VVSAALRRFDEQLHSDKQAEVLKAARDEVRQESNGLPDTVEPEGVPGDYAQGVLRTTLPKKELAKTRPIKVHVT
jgi:HSP20 family molecular chaperone IbpA